MQLGTMDTLVKGIKDALRGAGGRPRPPRTPPPRSRRCRPTVPCRGTSLPADPVFLLENAGRSFKHGSDGMHAESGDLVCRLSGHTVTGLSPSLLATGPGGSISGADLLVRGIDHGGVPPECGPAQLALTDPGSAGDRGPDPVRQHHLDRRGDRRRSGQAPSVAAAAAISEQDAAQVWP